MALARRFGREGFRIGLVARPGDPLDAPGALVLGADAGDPEALDQALRRLSSWGGEPEVAVYNASRGLAAPAADLQDPQLLADFQVNVASALACARWALPPMRRRRRGTLLFTGGGLALHPGPGAASLSLGKAALRSLALSLAQELEEDGVHAATVTIRGFIQEGSPFDADTVAQAFWELHREAPGAWRPEAILDPLPVHS
jgi:NAD(P)-dependent dehydrogenase (short-subunit alcohol dehydrogenase family)